MNNTKEVSAPLAQIEAVMAQRGLSWAKLGRIMGTTRQNAQMIASGANRSATSRYALASALGIPPVVLWPETFTEPDRKGA